VRFSCHKKRGASVTAVATRPPKAEARSSEAPQAPSPLVLKGLSLPPQVRGGADDLALPDASDVRFGILRALWFVSPVKAERQCRRYAAPEVAPDGLFVESSTLPIRVRQESNGSVTAAVGGLRTCGSWHCPVDGSKIAHVRAAEMEHMLKLHAAAGEFEDLVMRRPERRLWVKASNVLPGDVELQREERGRKRVVWVKVRRRETVKAGGSVVFLTVSARHHVCTELKALITAMRKASKAMSSGRAAQDIRRELGIVWQDRIFECTHGDEFGFHPHFHYVLFLDDEWVGDPSEEGVREAFMPLWELWRRSLAGDGFEALAEVNGQSAGFDARLVDLSSASAIVEMARYAHKEVRTDGTEAVEVVRSLDRMVELGVSRDQAVQILALKAKKSAEEIERQAGSGAREMLGGVWKRGKAPEIEHGHRHRSIAQVMEDMAVRGEPADVVIVQEFKATMSELRMPQHKSSPGMRAAFVQLRKDLQDRGVDIPGALDEVEQTDEEIAAQEEEAETFGHIDRQAYAAWFAWEISEMRAAARTGGVAGLYRFLADPIRNRARPAGTARERVPLGFELATGFV
jgi:hypothetical protein